MIKKLSLVLLAVLLFGNLQVYAANASLDQYQAIIDELNQKYGTDVRLANSKEEHALSASGVVRSSRTDLTEFRARLESAIIQGIAEKEQAIEAWNSINSDDVLFEGDDIQVSSNSQRSLAPSLRCIKKLRHFNAILYGDCTTSSSGARIFTKIWYAQAKIYSTDNEEPYFVMKSYSYKVIDGGRTCAVNYKGKTIMDTVPATVVDSDARFYVEFYAKKMRDY
jgi:hypothetical protein